MGVKGSSSNYTREGEVTFSVMSMSSVLRSKSSE